MQLKPKSAATFWIGIDTDPPFHSRDGLCYDGQPNTSARIMASGMKPLKNTEDFVSVFHRNSDPIVLKPDPGATSPVFHPNVKLRHDRGPRKFKGVAE